MGKQRLIRLVIFGVIAALLVWRLQGMQTKEVVEENSAAVLSVQTEEKIEQIKDLIKEQEIGKKVLGTVGEIIPALKRGEDEEKSQVEVIVEEKVREIIKEIQSLPAEQIEEVKKEFFCNEFCQTTCQEVCQ